MQYSQRVEWNHALEYAVQQANQINQPLLVLFIISDQYPEMNERHYVFMLEGLLETQRALLERGIRMVIQFGNPSEKALEMSMEAALLVVDRGYLRHSRRLTEHVAQKAACPVVQVESDLIVPLEVASNKEEWSAATLRPKLFNNLPDYLVPLTVIPVRRDSLHLEYESVDLSNLDQILSKLSIDRRVRRVQRFLGGTSEAKRLMTEFVDNKLQHYHEKRNDPTADYQSHLSPYLNFGQISPLYIALEALKSPYRAGVKVFLEELIVRRELSFNFVYYNDRYDSYEGLPAWAKQTLAKHQGDFRDYVYLLEEFENAITHDPYWNAAMREMIQTGKMHNYMRMYWCKKIIEWTRSPEEAFQIALHLNNKYFLDGRNPNSYAGVAWCFGKHDRPWPERPVFGKVRYMNANGLKRKFDIEAYVRKYSE